MSHPYSNLEGIILMGPFGSGKSHLGRALATQGIGRYTDLEPIIYDLFSNDDDLDIEPATAYIRQYYLETLAASDPLIAVFESTGVVQRPLLLEVMSTFTIALIRIQTPKDTCLTRVEKRNQTAKYPTDLTKAEQFYDYWHNEIAHTYTFSLNVDGTNETQALAAIQQLIAN